MGYASLTQTHAGLHMHQRAGAFIAFIVAEAPGDIGVRRALFVALLEEYGNTTATPPPVPRRTIRYIPCGNDALVATHQHSGVSGFLENWGNKGMAPYACVTSPVYLAFRAPGSVEPHAMPGTPPVSRASSKAQSATQATIRASPPFVVSLSPPISIPPPSPQPRRLLRVSPCQPYDDQLCAADNSTCGGRVQQCHGRGPAFERGKGQGLGIRAVQRRVQSAHAYAHMSQDEFMLANGMRVRQQMVPFWFAGGTTHGPGAFDLMLRDNKTSQ
ncbi:hypothetical protein B0H19DRAFT_1262935 [Mycena capillaripes]|nr:hypothetical protein B0H19DRAFT_1262935 [Mycena capillaripes]